MPSYRFMYSKQAERQRTTTRTANRLKQATTQLRPTIQVYDMSIPKFTNSFASHIISRLNGWQTNGLPPISGITIPIPIPICPVNLRLKLVLISTH